MTIFDFLNSLLFSKKKDSITSIDQESNFSPYMINRWASMYSPELALTANKLNKYLSVFEDKRTLFSLFLNIFPKVQFKKINYIKKKKAVEQETDEKIPLIAKNLEISQREVNHYIAFLKN
jgi:hypothetical protein